MKDPTRVKDLIIETLDLGRVMLDYGVQFTYDPMAVDEVQYRCPFHGRDNKPSARFYRQTKSCYCWVCKRKWDVISFIRDKETLPYIQTLQHIVARYGIDTSVIPEEPDIRKHRAPSTSDISTRMRSVRGKLHSLRGKLDYKKFNALVWAYHQAMFLFAQKKDISSPLIKLESKLKGV